MKDRQNLPESVIASLKIHIENLSSKNKKASKQRIFIGRGANNARLGANNTRLNANNTRLGANNARPSANNARNGANNTRLSANNTRLGANNARPGANNARPGANNVRPGANNARLGANNVRLGTNNARLGANAKRDRKTLRDLINKILHSSATTELSLFIKQTDQYLHYSNGIMIAQADESTAAALIVLVSGIEGEQVCILLFLIIQIRKDVIFGIYVSRGWIFDGVIDRYCGVPP